MVNAAAAPFRRATLGAQLGAQFADARLHHTSPLSSPQASDYKKPLNVGSDEMVSMNQMADLVKGFAGKAEMPTKHIPGPEGVRGRNSDNTLIKEVLGWAPSISLKEGLGYTHAWIQSQIELWVKEGNTLASLTQSKVCSQQMTDKCDQAHKDETQ